MLNLPDFAMETMVSAPIRERNSLLPKVSQLPGAILCPGTEIRRYLSPFFTEGYHSFSLKKNPLIGLPIKGMLRFATKSAVQQPSILRGTVDVKIVLFDTIKRSRQFYPCNLSPY